MLELKIAGMTCGGCEQSVVKTLSQIDGVEEVRASHKDGTVKVEGTPDPKRIVHAIEAAGYDVAP